MISDDEPPALEPFGGSIPVDSNDNIPPLLAPNDPVPSTGKRRNEQKKTRDYHEKYTTEKPEKKVSKFYQDVNDDADETWVPSKKSLKDRYNRRLRKEVDSVASRRNKRRVAPREEEPEPTEEIRRSNRTRRLPETVVTRYPNLKSIYDKPNYRVTTDEEFMELTRAAKKREEEKNKKRVRKPKTVSSDSTNVAAPDSRKRTHEDLQEPTTSKRNRTDDIVELISVTFGVAYL